MSWASVFNRSCIFSGTNGLARLNLSSESSPEDEHPNRPRQHLTLLTLREREELVSDAANPERVLETVWSADRRFDGPLKPRAWFGQCRQGSTGDPARTQDHPHAWPRHFCTKSMIEPLSESSLTEKYTMWPSASRLTTILSPVASLAMTDDPRQLWGGRAHSPHPQQRPAGRSAS